MIKKNIINHLLKNSGKLLIGETWYLLGEKYGVQSPNKKRALTDEKYRKDSIARATQQYWQNYVKQESKLELVKQTFNKGKLAFETFKKEQAEIVPVDFSEYEIEKLTTNPNGQPWLKMKKKEDVFNKKHLESLKDILTKELKPSKYRYRVDVSTNEKALFIYSSDKHIGALTKENSVYTNKYDKEEMRKRIVIKTIQIIDEAVKLHGEFNSIFYLDLGDALDGFNGKTVGGLRGTSSHDLPQQLNNREQIDFYVELHKELFDTIFVQEYAKEIYFIATSNSNHGGDFEYGAMRHLETYLNIKYPDIRTFVSHKPYNHFFYGKHCIIFGHGKDDEDMKSGLPLTLNPKVENYLADYIRINKLDDYIITFVSGDLHQSAETYAKNFRYKKVLSQYGSSKWIHTNFGSGSPGLSIEIMNKEENKIVKEDVFFPIINQSNTGITF